MTPQFSGNPTVKATSLPPQQQKNIALIGHQEFHTVMGRKKSVVEHVLTRTPDPKHYAWGLNKETRGMSLGRPIPNTMVCVEVSKGQGNILGWAWIDDAVKHVVGTHLDIWWVQPSLQPMSTYPYATDPTVIQ